MKEINEMSTQELEALLAKKKKAEKDAWEKKRKAYEADRDQRIKELMGKAGQLSLQLKLFKQQCHSVMEEQAIQLAEYGKIRSNSKGGFQVTDSAGKHRIVRRRDTVPYWDERGTKGIQLVKEFLEDTVKKRDKKLFEILISFLARNKAGDLEYNRVMNLMKHEDKFEDPRWKEGLHLIKESYSNTLKAYAYEFKTLAADGSWDSFTLNFSAL